MINEEGYACVDSITYSLKVVVSDEKPTAEKAFCPPNGYYTKQKDKAGCENKPDYSGIYPFTIFVFAFYALLNLLLALINKYTLKCKLALKDRLWISLLSILIVPIGFAFSFFVVGALLLFGGFDSDNDISFFAGLSFAVFLAYVCIKSLLVFIKK